MSQYEDTLRGEAQIPKLAVLWSNTPITKKVGSCGYAWEAKSNIGSLLRLFVVSTYQEELLDKRWQPICSYGAGKICARVLGRQSIDMDVQVLVSMPGMLA